MKKAIVAGANGFVGSAVAAHLQSQGIEVLALSTSERAFKTHDYAFLAYDKDNPNKLESDLRNLNWKADESSVLFNFSWRGKAKLTDGSLQDQLRNVENSVETVNLAKKLGCSKFINCGTQEESFLEESLKNPALDFKLTQINYAIAKLASRDYCKYTAYNLKIDYIHTRLSVPVSRNLARENYIERTIREILEGQNYKTPENSNIFDVVSIDDVAEAYLRIGLNGKNRSNYFIGSGQPRSLAEYFSYVGLVSNGKEIPRISTLKSIERDLFDTTAVEKDTGYVPKNDFKEYLKRNLAK
jgi:nucleoside-diphosphate-sugar epimerase